MSSNKPTLHIGAHMSAAGGAYRALERAAEIGASALQLFTSNQKQWRGRPIPEEDVDRWKQARDETGIEAIVSHDSYLINLGSEKEEILEKSLQSFAGEIERCRLLEIPYLNFHPGTATSKDEELCLEQIVKSLLSFEQALENSPTRLLLETTAGQGNSVGYRFEHLAYILERVLPVLPIGVCIDTCHIFAAGYDLASEGAVASTLKTFDEKIGLEHLYALHINDTKKPLGSRRDRHASLGKGEIGLSGIEALVTNPNISQLPLILETPEPALYKQEINQLKEYITHAS